MILLMMVPRMAAAECRKLNSGGYWCVKSIPRDPDPLTTETEKHRQQAARQAARMVVKPAPVETKPVTPVAPPTITQEDVYCDRRSRIADLTRAISETYQAMREERKNPSGYVNASQLYEWGKYIQGAQAEISEDRADMRRVLKITKKKITCDD